MERKGKHPTLFAHAAAKQAGCDAVKFQKRTPEICVPPEQREISRETPWGVMSYLEYRHRVEFGSDEYAAINDYCGAVGIDWFASCWDAPEHRTSLHAVVTTSRRTGLSRVNGFAEQERSRVTKMWQRHCWGASDVAPFQ